MHLGRGDGGAGSDRALYLRSTAFIQQHLCCPVLTPDAVAAALCVSRRQLYRVHERHGTTVAGLIRRLRLERCCRDLADPGLAHLPVGAIAARWGFPGHAEFTRTFKRRLGVTPSEYRAGARVRCGSAEG
ncbi:helix-turn-helix domain-containing protein [Streptomyces sp. NBRC 109706]|uniref:helix-turn-helix domain-containing protein n=1 Tax=Streptomyces sp. NBRC 109706 TaxID=1550035 RepID=UPI000785C453|nr:helix-turn-helix domain-containing protein [Streptomyces sp. NBRC 109706]